VTAFWSELLEIYKRERDKELVNEDARFLTMESDGGRSAIFEQNRYSKSPNSGTQKGWYNQFWTTGKDTSNLTMFIGRPNIVFENRLWQDHVILCP